MTVSLPLPQQAALPSMTSSVELEAEIPAKTVAFLVSVQHAGLQVGQHLLLQRCFLFQAVKQLSVAKELELDAGPGVSETVAAVAVVDSPSNNFKKKYIYRYIYI